MRQAQHAPREEKITMSDLFTKYWPVVVMAGIFLLTTAAIKQTNDYQDLQLKEHKEKMEKLEQANQDAREMLIEIKTDLKYIKEKIK